jgi:hypothetical protein
MPVTRTMAKLADADSGTEGATAPDLIAGGEIGW